MEDYRNDSLSSHLNTGIDKNNATIKYAAGKKAKLVTILSNIVAVLKKNVTHKAIVDAEKKARVVRQIGGIKALDDCNFSRALIFGKAVS